MQMHKEILKNKIIKFNPRCLNQSSSYLNPDIFVDMAAVTWVRTGGLPLMELLPAEYPW